MSPEDNANINSKRLAKELLLGIEHRGKDATGVAFIDALGRVQAHKAPLTAKEFIRTQRLTLPRRASAAIMHTRAGTKGSERDNRNNHPIVVANGHMVGVHNGVLYNDDDIFKYLGPELRIGQVDSEAIFALLAHSNASIEDNLSSLEGSVAIAWMTTDEGPDTLHLARVSSSPLIVGQTEGGSLIFASTEWVLKDTAKELGLDLTHIRHTPEGQHLIVKQGKVEDVRTFEPPRSFYSTWDPWDAYERVPGTQSTYRKKGASSGVVTHLPPVNKAEDTVLAEKLKAERGVVNVYPVKERRKADEQMVARSMMPLRLFDQLEEVGTKDYHEWYGDREQAIDDLWSIAQFENLEGEQRMCEKLHVFLRPGDYVKTSFGGRDVTAQVIALPNEFPGGFYTLRARVPNANRQTGGKEEVIVFQRYSYEFDEVNPYNLTKTTPAVAGTD